MYWYSKQKPELKQNGKFETLVEFASRIDQEEGILIDSIKMLWYKDEETGEYKYPRQRDKFLNKNYKAENGRMLVEHLLKFHNQENARLARILEKLKIKDLPGLKSLHETESCYKLLKVEGSRDERKSVFQQVTAGMGNCLGGTELVQYLEKSEGDKEIYLIRDEKINSWLQWSLTKRLKF